MDGLTIDLHNCRGKGEFHYFLPLYGNVNTICGYELEEGLVPKQHENNN